MSALVVDANAAVKWVIDEAGNALWTKSRRAEPSAAEADELLT